MKPLRQVISELIGRSSAAITRIWVNMRPMRATQDNTRTDYRFWDMARRGYGVEGLQISGLFLKVICSKIRSWTLGEMPHFEVEHPGLMEELNRIMAQKLNQTGDAWEEALNLGDAFIVVNADLSLTLITPDIVEPIVDEEDYSQIVGWRIVQRFDHPTEIGRFMIETNEYTADERVRTVEMDGRKPTVDRFPNLIGLVPVIHIPNNVQSNEVWGKPEAAALVSSEKGLLHRYGEVLDAATDGNLHQGRPTPVGKFDTPSAMQAFFDTYGKVETNEKTGEKSAYLDWHSDKFTAMVGGDFKWEAPGAFIGESEKLLAILYWIMLEFLELPEFVMGTAIASSRASAETQMPIFIEYIKKKRGQMGGWLTQLAQVTAAYLGLLNGWPVGEVTLNWDALVEEDERLIFDVLQWLYSERLVDDETAVIKAPGVNIDNPLEVLQKARAQREEERDLLSVEREIARQAMLNGDGVPMLESGEDEDEAE